MRLELPQSTCRATFSSLLINTAFLLCLLLNLYYLFVNLRLYLYLYVYLYLTMSPAGAESAHLSGPLNHPIYDDIIN